VVYLLCLLPWHTANCGNASCLAISANQRVSIALRFIRLEELELVSGGCHEAVGQFLVPFPVVPGVAGYCCLAAIGFSIYLVTSGFM
jgi:hypothetical protein